MRLACRVIDLGLKGILISIGWLDEKFADVSFGDGGGDG